MAKTPRIIDHRRARFIADWRATDKSRTTFVNPTTGQKVTRRGLENLYHGKNIERRQKEKRTAGEPIRKQKTRRDTYRRFFLAIDADGNRVLVDVRLPEARRIGRYKHTLRSGGRGRKFSFKGRDGNTYYLPSTYEEFKKLRAAAKELYGWDDISDDDIRGESGSRRFRKAA